MLFLPAVLAMLGAGVLAQEGDCLRVFDGATGEVTWEAPAPTDEIADSWGEAGADIEWSVDGAVLFGPSADTFLAVGRDPCGWSPWTWDEDAQACVLRITVERSTASPDLPHVVELRVCGELVADVDVTPCLEGGHATTHHGHAADDIAVTPLTVQP